VIVELRIAVRGGYGWRGSARASPRRHAHIEAAIVPHYVETGIVARSPFATIDERGVGELVQIAIERGRDARPGLEVGICGEHGGDPASIRFSDRAGLDYVSCSPFRVPIARVAAAQAAAARR
jgi:pyruvate,orthophosphate dikinase